MNLRAIVLAAISLAGALAAPVVGGLLAGCGSPPAKQELGKLPTAVTTAEPEWLPFAIRAGARAEDDPREARIGELREIRGAGTVARASWASDGRSMVLENELGVVVLDLSTGKIVRVSDAGEHPSHGVSAGPHGEYVLYATSASGGPDGAKIVSVRRDGTDRKVLRAGSHPFLVGDGSRPLDALFCLTSARQLVLQPIRATDADLSFDDATTLQSLGAVTDLSVSADRTRAAWLTQDGGLQIASLGASGEVRAQRGIGSQGVSAPAFHPDGRHVVLSTTIDDLQPQLALVDADAVTQGSHANPARERITFADGGARAPAFSRDGRYLAFVSGRAGPGSSNLFIARWRDER